MELLEIRFSGTAITIGSTAVYLSHGSKVYLYITHYCVFKKTIFSFRVHIYKKNCIKSCIIYYLIFYRAGEGYKFLRHYDCFCINVLNETSFTFLPYQNIMDGLWHHVAVTWTALDVTDPAFPKGVVTLFIDNQVVAKQEDFATGMQLPPL